MKIGIAQLNSVDSLEKNLTQIQKIIGDSQKHNPDLIVFPENSLFFRIRQDQKIEPVSLSSDIIRQLEQSCRDNNVSIHFTTPVLENDMVFNASILIERNSSAKVVYRKIHLFDIELQGQKPIRESDVFSEGRAPAILDYGGIKFGNSICYDIRFAELYSVYAKAAVDVILVPSAFLVKTGRDHWETLLRARAIESQCYVVASAQAGVHKSVATDDLRETYGHSMLIDPWGNILAIKESDVGVLYGDILKAEIEKVRRQIPMSFHRRIDF